MKTEIIIALLLVIVFILVSRRASGYTPSCWRSCCQTQTISGPGGPAIIPNSDCLAANSLEEYCPVKTQPSSVDNGDTDDYGNALFGSGANITTVLRTDPGCSNVPAWGEVVYSKPAWAQQKGCGQQWGQKGFGSGPDVNIWYNPGGVAWTGTAYVGSFPDYETYCKEVSVQDPCCNAYWGAGSPRTAASAQAAAQYQQQNA